MFYRQQKSKRVKKQKWLLFGGLVLIFVGIFLKVFGVLTPPPAILFSIGGTMKLAFLGIEIATGRLKPGIEFLFLAGGLFLLVLAIIAKNQAANPWVFNALIIKAVLLKVIFLVLYFRKQREKRRSA